MITFTWTVGLMASLTTAVPQAQPVKKLDPVPDRRPEFVAKLGAACPLNNVAGEVALRDVLESVSDQTSIPIWIDPIWVRRDALENGGGFGLPPLMGKADQQKNLVVARAEVNLTPDELPVRLPDSKHVRLSSFLSHVLAQVDATYLLRPDHILVTSTQRAETMIARDAPPPRQDPFLDDPSARVEVPETYTTLVQLAEDRRSMAELFHLVAAQTGCNVLVSPGVAEKAKNEVSVRLYNTPVRAAVESLAQMAELGVIERGNVLIVTSQEQAEAWEAK